MTQAPKNLNFSVSFHTEREQGAKKGNSTVKRHVYIENIDGQKVRAQYFSYPIALLLSLLIPSLITIFILGLCGEIPMSEVYDTYIHFGVIFGFILLFLIVLWILVRLRLGFVVCVLDSDGIHHDGGMIPWDNIQTIVYHMRMPGRTYSDEPNICRAVMYTKNDEITVDYAPLHLLRLAKKARPGIKTRLSRETKGVVATCVIIPAIFILSFLLAPLFM